MQISKRHITRFWTATLMVISLSASQLNASGFPKHYRSLCDQATLIAATDFNVPIEIMKAIARTESGVTLDGRFAPWPWTMNVDGQGVHFSSSEKAWEFFMEAVRQGAENIDVGCFQINHRWHGANFPSQRAMLDPVSNASYAAQFLNQLHSEFGDWIQAAGAYHSRNFEVSQKYVTKLIPILNDVSTPQVAGRTLSNSGRSNNTFPLLKGISQGRARGSLFPMENRSGKSLFRRIDPRG